MSAARATYVDRIPISSLVSISPPTQEDLQYLLISSGITEEVARDANIGRATHLDAQALVGNGHKGNLSGIVFPLYWPGMSDCSGVTIRRDHPDQEQRADGTFRDSKKYVIAEGSRNRIGFIRGTDPSLLGDIRVPAFIVEGPKKLCAAYRLATLGLGDAAESPRFVAMALSGAWNFRGRIAKTQNASGVTVDVRGVIDDFQRIAWADRKVIVALDRDVLSNTSIQDALKQLVRVLQDLGARAFVFPWPKNSAEIPASVKGIDDLLALKGPEFVIDWINKAKARKSPKPKKQRAQNAPEDLTVNVIAEEICKSAHFAQDPGVRLYLFEDGYYQPKADVFIKQRVKQLLPDWEMSDEWASRTATEVTEYIRVDATTLWERPPRDEVNVENGILNVRTRKLRPHDYRFLSTIQLPVRFDPIATCPKWETFVNSVFPSDATAIAYEILAWLMTPDTSIQKAVLATGEGANGKSRYLAAVLAFTLVSVGVN